MTAFLPGDWAIGHAADHEINKAHRVLRGHITSIMPTVELVRSHGGRRWFADALRHATQAVSVGRDNLRNELVSERNARLEAVNQRDGALAEIARLHEAWDELYCSRCVGVDDCDRCPNCGADNET